MATVIQIPDHINIRSVFKRMLLGASIAFAIIALMVFSVNSPNPDWGTYWMIRPLIITPIIGSFGILSFYLKDFIRPQSDVMALIVFIISFIAFAISLWMGTILGLVGTLWN